MANLLKPAVSSFDVITKATIKIKEVPYGVLNKLAKNDEEHKNLKF